MSASSAALDLANLQSSSPEAKLEAKSNRWSAFSRHHQPQHSLTQNNENVKFGRASLHSPSSSQQSVETVVEAPDLFKQANRHSMGASLASLSSPSNHAKNGSNGVSLSRPILSVVHSHSTNDIPTMKGAPAISSTMTNSPVTANNDNVFHKHGVGLNRIPGNIITNRLSRDLTTGEALADEPPATAKFPPSIMELQASAAPFGPSVNTTATAIDRAMVGSIGPQNFSAQDYIPYGMTTINMGMNQMQMAGMNGGNYTNGMQMFTPHQQHQQHFSGFGQYNPGGRFPDSQQKIIQQRRAQNGEGNRRNSRRGSHAHSDPDTARFSNTKIETYVGEIYTLCKDQHGCRYLQKQLEARHPETVQLIFLETAPHVIELMTDPFGNYLCQKLLEHTNDSQRTALVENAAPHMVQIALNQHGTRALQKMIEHLSTKEQIAAVRNALKDKVVELIQDLNGNHVIQKCLNRLTAEDSQFIFDAVGNNCVVVGTHRHGCCVLQRCIDHASGIQKANLIAQITANAFKLIQDPYGNYVLQYIVDLNDPSFTEPLCHSLRARVVELSRHKFSSNVIEKCIRHAAPSVATMMIEEMLGAVEIERMLRDSFANYVVQTALDCADVTTRARLVDAIRPILPSIRSTPHGRRIQSKIIQSENSSHATSPTMSPIPSSASIPGNGPMNRNVGGPHQPPFYVQPSQPGYSMTGFGNQPGFTQPSGPVSGQRVGNNGTYPPFNPMAAQNSMHQSMPQGFGRAPQATGYNFF